MGKRKDEMRELVTQGRVRNRLLTAKAMQAELRAAAARVQRLSQPGTPERFFTLMEVEQDTGISGADIVEEITRSRSQEEAP